MDAGDASLGKFLLGMGDDALTRLLAEVYRLDAPRLERVFAAAKKLAAGPTLADYEPDAAMAAVNFEARDAAEAAADPEAPRNGGKDPVNALWSFEGHRLRELRPATANPHNPSQLHHNAGEEGSTAGAEVDEDGHAVLYGSCGRGKRYARCSVCYFRGLRCNTGYYCACCQRPVCIRPRTYPGEEHPKICWNVLHVDKDMVQRVEKKKKRKLQQAMGCAVADTTPALLPAPIAPTVMDGALHGEQTQEAPAQDSPFAPGLLEHQEDGHDAQRQEDTRLTSAAAPSVAL